MNNRRRNYRLIGILMCVIGLVLIFGTLMHEIPVPHASSTRTSIPEEDSLKCRGWFTPEWILLQHEKMSCDSMEDILHETYPTLNASCTDSFSLLFRDGQNEDEYGTLELIQESKNFEMKKGPTHDVKNPFNVSISGKGMHWNMHVTSSLHGGMWLVQPVSLGIYVDSYELLELERKNLLITRALTGHIEVEKPSYASSLHLVAIWFNLSSENGTETTSSYPLHLRYGAPTWNGDKYETVHFPPPLIQYVKMEDMQTSLENGPDFTQLKWLNEPMNLNVPVGQLQDMWLVQLCTFLVTMSASLLILLLAVCKKSPVSVVLSPTSTKRSSRSRPSRPHQN